MDEKEKHTPVSTIPATDRHPRQPWLRAPWKPGQTGNPLGKRSRGPGDPPGISKKERIRWSVNYLELRIPDAVKALVRRALKNPDGSAMRLWIERVMPVAIDHALQGKTVFEGIKLELTQADGNVTVSLLQAATSSPLPAPTPREAHIGENADVRGVWGLSFAPEPGQESQMEDPAQQEHEPAQPPPEEQESHKEGAVGHGPPSGS